MLEIVPQTLTNKKTDEELSIRILTLDEIEINVARKIKKEKWAESELKCRIICWSCFFFKICTHFSQMNS